MHKVLVKNTPHSTMEGDFLRVNIIYLSCWRCDTCLQLVDPYHSDIFAILLLLNSGIRMYLGPCHVWHNVSCLILRMPQHY